MHYAFGKPTWWITITPDDQGSLRVWKLSPDDFKGTTDLVEEPSRQPLINLRCENLSNNPGAAALNFDDILHVLITKVLNWDYGRQACRKPGGLFGPTEAWSYSVETQGRGTLHAHLLLWVGGHGNLLNRLQALYDDGNLADFQTAVEQLQQQLDTVISCELPLPESTLETMDRCLDANCEGSMEAVSNARLMELRKKGHGNDPVVVKCSTCDKRYGSIEVIKSALRASFGDQTCPLDSEDVLDALKWKHTMRPSGTDQEIYVYNLNVAALAVTYNLHDPNHRSSCFKKSCFCRYKAPHQPQKETKIQMDDTPVEDDVISFFIVTHRRRPAMVYMSSYNPELLEMFKCNTYVSYVNDHRLSFYLGCYQTKHYREDDISFGTALGAVLNYHRKNVGNANFEARSLYSQGLGRLCAGVCAHTSSDMVAGQMAAHLLLGGHIFNFSHPFQMLPVQQGREFLMPKKLAAGGNIANVTILFVKLKSRSLARNQRKIRMRFCGPFSRT
jgi:hypothetical protein